MGRVKGCGRRRKEREEKITVSQNIEPSRASSTRQKNKKRIGTSSILAWGKSGVGFSTMSKSYPDASVEIALNFLLGNTCDIPCRSNSSLSLSVSLIILFTTVQNKNIYTYIKVQ